MIVMGDFSALKSNYKKKNCWQREYFLARSQHGTQESVREKGQLSWKAIFLFAIFGSCIYGVSNVHGQAPAGHDLQSIFPGGNIAGSSSSESNCDLFYIIVSTIDGKVSALDLHTKGKLIWSLEADSKPLYSSSLASMEMVRNGKKMRLIPSLDGALYQYDGEKVEAIPMSAETLLSSTYRLSDDSMIVGSKELKNFGVDLSTGEVMFYCGSEGCHHADSAANDGSIDGNSVLVVTRSTQVVRSVDIKNGQEKWNFSVGQHEIRLPPASQTSQINEEDDENDNHESSDEEKIPVFTPFRQCPHEEKYAADADYKDFLRLVVPEGRVVALDKEDSSLVNWEHKFDSPIAKAWLYKSGQLETLSLFDGRHVPTVNEQSPEEQENESMPSPLLYIGSHQKLLYIQTSPQMDAVLRSFPTSRIGHVLDPNIQVAWRPYLNTASVRTPIFSGNRPFGDRIGNEDGESESSKSTSLSVWHEDYPFDTGYFLYPEFRDARSTRKGLMMRIEDLHQGVRPASEEGWRGYLPAILSKYWKHMLVTSIVLSVGIHFLCSKFLFHGLQTSQSFSTTDHTNESSGVEDSQESLITSDSQPDGLNYTSRFVTDFECLRCLGTGGFGVVFEAVNKVDEQHYAVKRIMLPKSDGAKEKVLREVKALAKLDHPGIVRFFNAWVESPPAGWQEDRDKHYLPSDITGTNFSPSPSVSFTSPNQRSNRLAQKRKQCLEARARKFQTEKQGLMPDVEEEASLQAESTTDSIVFSNNDVPNMQPTGSSGEFSVHSNLTNSSSGRLSGHPSPKNDLISFGYDSFPSSRENSNSDSRSSIPFSNYSSTSSMALSHPPHPTDSEMTGDSVVFESSSCTGTGTKSVIFADTSHRPDPNSSAKVVSASNDLAIDITLSSHDDREEDKQCSHQSNTQAKLYLYIQMQLYQEDTLKDWLSNNTLNRDRQSVLTIFDEIVCAVDYVHKQGLMHRDLKPSNIFFSADGHIKVGDFGLATAISVQQDQESGGPASFSDKHTAEVGTTLYMSPEQIANKPYDLKVDIFSLGLIFLELWVPFSTQMERIHTLKAAKTESLPERFIKELPAESGLVLKMTCKDPEKRPVTDEILRHSLFEDIVFLRTDHWSRKRTVSERST